MHEIGLEPTARQSSPAEYDTQGHQAPVRRRRRVRMRGAVRLSNTPMPSPRTQVFPCMRYCNHSSQSITGAPYSNALGNGAGPSMVTNQDFRANPARHPRPPHGYDSLDGGSSQLSQPPLQASTSTHSVRRRLQCRSDHRVAQQTQPQVPGAGRANPTPPIWTAFQFRDDSGAVTSSLDQCRPSIECDSLARCNPFLPFLEHKVPGGTLPLVSVPSARSPGVFTPADRSPVFDWGDGKAMLPTPFHP